ncbi:26S proteasome non-ATPase regulatory subunit 7-like [Convolutriloba macropyga]|uniref:26S proteasome non-ATPase regulatory subunit 7-like n=1 Tax=Convolutriloba macropyga TaxID=536237 RepID=UPI003F51D10B
MATLVASPNEGGEKIPKVNLDNDGVNGIKEVIVHPLVLLSVVDHFNRVAATTSDGRAVGVLLGSISKGRLDVANSFAIPFEEDAKDAAVWFMDHDYLESMYAMFKKVNAKEKIVGWYHTGPKLKNNDININELIRKYNPNAVLIVIDTRDHSGSDSVDTELHGLPTNCYTMVEEVHDDGTPTCKTFEHLPSEIGAEEAEEVGVEHLLRDIRQKMHGTLSQRVTFQVGGLKGLSKNLKDIEHYLDAVVKGELPIHHQIVYELQNVLNLLPDVNFGEFVKSYEVQTNDEMAVVYLGTVIRTIVALHNLLNNKIHNRQLEESKKEESKRAKDEKDKEKSASGDKKEDSQKSDKEKEKSQSSGSSSTKK